MHGLRVFHTARAEHRQATEVGKEALRIAQRLQDSELLAEAYLDVGVPLLYRGEVNSAIENFRQSLMYTDAQQDTIQQVYLISARLFNGNSLSKVSLKEFLLAYQVKFETLLQYARIRLVQ